MNFWVSTEGAPILSETNVARPGPGHIHRGSRSLLNQLVAAVRLDLEDVELPVERVVRLRREAEAAAEDPLRDPHVLDYVDQRAPARERVVVLSTGGLQGLQDHLDRAVGRRPERADRLAGVVPLPAGDDRLVVGEEADRRREVREIRARELELRRVVRTVGAEDLRLLALLGQLLGDRLRVA